METEKTDLTKILTVSGQHGLFRYLAQSRTGAIVESLATGDRTVFGPKNKINTLADISIYVKDGGEMKLADVFGKLRETLGEADAPAKSVAETEVKALFEKAVPDYDPDRFYVSHMRKICDWYNDLKNHASLEFVSPEEAEKAEEEAEEKASESGDKTNE